SKTQVTASIMRPTPPTSDHTWVSMQPESFLLRDIVARGPCLLRWTTAFKQRWQRWRKGSDLLRIAGRSVGEMLSTPVDSPKPAKLSFAPHPGVASKAPPAPASGQPR